MGKEFVDFQQLEDTIRRLPKGRFLEWVRTNITYESLTKIVGQIYGEEGFPEYDTPFARILKSTVNFIKYHNEADPKNDNSVQDLLIEVTEKRGFLNSKE